MWRVAMKRLATASKDGDNNDVQQTTLRPPSATVETVTYVSNYSELPLPRTSYSHPPWASYQENLAFVYAGSQRRQHQHPSPLQDQNVGAHQQNLEPHQQNTGAHPQYFGLHRQNHGNHRYNPNPGHQLHQPNHGLKQNHGEHQQNLGLHQQRPSLHQRHPIPADYTSSPAMSQTTAQTQYGKPIGSSHRDMELVRAEQYVSNIERQLGLTLNGGTLRNAQLSYQDRYTSSSGNPTVTAQGPQLNSHPVTWYQTSYPSPSYNSNPHRTFRRTRYPRELPMFPTTGINPFFRHQTPTFESWHGPYTKEEEHELYGNRWSKFCVKILLGWKDVYTLTDKVQVAVAQSVRRWSPSV
ncbi:hypothetical protein LOTGIDRAFT_171839 [Lottia gigantea]|uniref:Uncharacterized protein n=1 Tax=Lottia gigantea TaxID=225164 RepID=V4AYG3_LOTGI|nr:hypothetical protein LOTGIDRAFT_171839 [Lottia gigantea]ESP02638.1 hypothetical protein LOTGIDRAFT_171839 [Lottia gigantea]